MRQAQTGSDSAWSCVTRGARDSSRAAHSRSISTDSFAPSISTLACSARDCQVAVIIGVIGGFHFSSNQTIPWSNQRSLSNKAHGAFRGRGWKKPGHVPHFSGKIQTPTSRAKDAREMGHPVGLCACRSYRGSRQLREGLSNSAARGLEIFCRVFRTGMRV
jgi:hypothetical protein